MKTEEFFAQRRSGIGSSDMPAILGISPFRSGMDVYLEKTGEAPATPVTAAMRVGLKLEPVIASEYVELTDNTLNKGETFFRHPDHEWFMTHPDRFVLDSKEAFSRLVELKSVGPYMANQWGEPGTDEVPEYIIAELQHRLKIIHDRFGIEYADVAAFFRSSAETRIYSVKYDPEIGQIMLDRAMEFWFEHVQKGVPPAMDGSPAATELLKRKYPRAEDVVITPTPAVQITVDKLKEALQGQATVNKVVAKLEQEIRFVMGTTSVLDLGDEKITWRQDKPGTKIDYKTMLAELKDREPALCAELLSSYSKTKDGARRFLVPRTWKRAEE